VVSGEDGSFLINGLRAGTYDVRVTAIGYVIRVIRSVHVGAGGKTRLNIRMKRAPKKNSSPTGHMTPGWKRMPWSIHSIIRHAENTGGTGAEHSATALCEMALVSMEARLKTPMHEMPRVPRILNAFLSART
jgi:hypothetical protein